MSEPRNWLGAYRQLLAKINAISGGGGSVSSVFTRTGAVVAAVGDYAASLVSNDSSVSGSTVKDALETLAAAGGAVSSVFTRTGAVVAALGDYAASLITNDSSVSGSTVKDALNNLRNQVTYSTNTPSQLSASGSPGGSTAVARYDHSHPASSNGGFSIFPFSAFGVGLVVNHQSGQTGDLAEFFGVSPGGTFSITATGKPRWASSGNEQTTVGAAGSASALPSAPVKYLKVVDSAGTTYVIPCYNA